MIVKELPKVDYTKGEGALIDFYVTLGWNRNDYLDPKKVLVNKADSEKLMEEFMAANPECRVSAGMFVMNYGPSTGESVPLGKVHLLKGWINKEEEVACSKQE